VVLWSAALTVTGIEQVLETLFELVAATLTVRGPTDMKVSFKVKLVVLTDAPTLSVWTTAPPMLQTTVIASLWGSETCREIEVEALYCEDTDVEQASTGGKMLVTLMVTELNTCSNVSLVAVYVTT
jgi:hypothetical protein